MHDLIIIVSRDLFINEIEITFCRSKVHLDKILNVNFINIGWGKRIHNESHHKRKKHIGRQTQRRGELFDEQTASGEYKYNLFIKAIRHAGIDVPKMFELTSSTIEERKEQIVDNNGSIFLLTFDYDIGKITAKGLSEKMKCKTPQWCPRRCHHMMTLCHHSMTFSIIFYKNWNISKNNHQIYFFLILCESWLFWWTGPFYPLL